MKLKSIAMTQVNHGIISLKKETKQYIPKAEFKRKEMLIWFIEARMEELNKISLAATNDRILESSQEYKRLKSGILYFLTRKYDDTFESSDLFFQYINKTITENINTVKETIINHINNDHLPQQIDLNRLSYLTAVKYDWQEYLNKIKHITE